MDETITLLKNGRILPVAVIGVFLILFGVSSQAIGLMAFIFCIFVVLFCENDVLVICCLACWMNFAQIFKLSVDGLSLYTLLVLLFAVKQLIKRKEIDYSFLVTLLVYAIFLVLGMKIQFFAAIKNIMMPVQLYVMAMCLDYHGLKKVSGFFILGTIIESIAASFKTIIPGLANYMSNRNVFAVATLEGYVPQSRFSGLWEDPNFYSIHLLLGILICLILFSRREIKGELFIAVTAVLTYFGLETLSKSFILMLALILIYAYVLFLKNKQIGRVIVLSLALFILVALIAAGTIDDFSLILERLREGITTGDSLTTGRTGIWKDYIYYFYTNPEKLLFGIGLGGSIPFKYAPHNAYLELILYIGLTGTFIFCLTIYNAIKAAWNFAARGLAVPVLCVLLMYFFLGVYNSLDLQVELLLVFGYLCLNKENEETETTDCKQGEIIRGYEINPDCQ